MLRTAYLVSEGEKQCMEDCIFQAFLPLNIYHKQRLQKKINMPKIIFLENIQKIAETELLNQKIQCSALIYSEKHDVASNFT